MCNDVRTVAYFMSNWETPNLIVRGPAGTYDLTATLANIEQCYGSKTQADATELHRRRAQKEKLKLRCIKYAISGPETDEEQTEVSYWMMPPKPSNMEAYTFFQTKDDINIP